MCLLCDKVIDCADFLPFLREGVQAVDSRLIYVIILSEPSVVLDRPNREHIVFAKPSEYGVEGGLGNLDIGFYGFDNAVAIAVLVSDCGEYADINQTSFELCVHKDASLQLILYNA